MPPDTKTRTSVDLERNCKLHVVPTAQPDITGREILADSRFWLLFATVFILVGSSLFIMSNIAFIVESLGGPMEQIPTMSVHRSQTVSLNQVGFGWKAGNLFRLISLMWSCRSPIKEVAEETAAVESVEPVVVAAVAESEEARGQQEQATAEADVEAAEPVVEENALV
ncbi:hypothetical protein PR003_g32616 [Phytophthora rubi]|uniref:Uncharacterized protein n=1 Tax=Phytophthora rubi TaxID=129364 RepID=A0A6A4B3P5_9STRA|nr:hypothetical protein PR003_g32616 [Phytophthora rubi]